MTTGPVFFLAADQQSQSSESEINADESREPETRMKRLLLISAVVYMNSASFVCCCCQTVNTVVLLKGI